MDKLEHEAGKRLDEMVAEKMGDKRRSHWEKVVIGTKLVEGEPVEEVYDRCVYPERFQAEAGIIETPDCPHEIRINDITPVKPYSTDFNCAIEFAKFVCEKASKGYSKFNIIYSKHGDHEAHFVWITNYKKREAVGKHKEDLILAIIVGGLLALDLIDQMKGKG